MKQSDIDSIKNTYKELDLNAKSIVQKAFALSGDDFLITSVLLLKASACVMANQLMGETDDIKKNDYAKIRDATLLYGMLLTEESERLQNAS